MLALHSLEVLCNSSIKSSVFNKLRKSSALVGLLVMLLSTQNIQANDCSVVNESATSGQLMLMQTSGSCSLSPQLDLDVEIVVTGTIARVKLEQHFRNPGQDWVEGIYVFPLPEDAAVDQLRLRIGERVIEGEIKEKRQAKAIYKAAKQAGQKASLLSQQRPNIFTTSVANIGPREMVTVTLEYQQTIRLDQGRFSLRFPMTITRRFIPGVKQVDDVGYESNRVFNTDTVPDATETSPPFGAHGSNNHAAAVSVDLMPGFPVANIDSLYHPVEKTQIDDQHYRIELHRDQHESNADFVLEWSPLQQEEPFASLFVEHKDNQQFVLAMLMPPVVEPENSEPKANSTASRDVVFVIDTSGSMAGESIRQAKQAISQAIDYLSNNDRFNIIEFNSYTHTLFSRVQPASKEIKAHALSFVRGLTANHGTQMYPAIERALLVGRKDKESNEASHRVRQIIFITDGAVGNEDQLFNLIKDRLGNSRFFTVGIGSAPNSHFMSKAAEFGRGTFTYIAQATDVKPRMSALFRKLASPVLTDIKIMTEDNQPIELYPDPVPDLYLGEPLLIAMKADQKLKQITITGHSNGRESWRRQLAVDQNVSRTGVSTLWARRKIDSLMNQYIGLLDPVSKDEKRLEITRLALDHHLVSRFTSLVAVDKRPVRASHQPLKTHALKNNVPKGSRLGLPRGATPAQLQLYSGLTCLLLAGIMAWFYARTSRFNAVIPHD